MKLANKRSQPQTQTEREKMQMPIPPKDLEEVSTTRAYRIRELTGLKVEHAQRELLQPNAVESLCEAIMAAGAVLEAITLQDGHVVDGQHRIQALHKILELIKLLEKQALSTVAEIDIPATDEEKLLYLKFESFSKKNPLIGAPPPLDQWVRENRTNRHKEKSTELSNEIQRLEAITFRFETLEDPKRLVTIRLGQLKNRVYIDQIRSIAIAADSGFTLRSIAKQISAQLGTLRSAERRTEVVSILGSATIPVIEKIQSAIERQRSTTPDQSESGALDQKWQLLSSESKMRDFTKYLKRQQRGSERKPIQDGNLDAIEAALGNWCIDTKQNHIGRNAISAGASAQQTGQTIILRVKDGLASVDGLTTAQTDRIIQLVESALKSHRQNRKSDELQENGISETATPMRLAKNQSKPA